MKFDYYFNWTYTGVDHKFAGAGGQECVDFIPARQKVFETFLFIGVAILEMCFAYPRLKLPKRIPPAENRDRTGKKVMLVIMCLTFGCEIGFKFSTKTMIWILNPCHMITAIQVSFVILGSN